MEDRLSSVKVPRTAHSKKFITSLEDVSVLPTAASSTSSRLSSGRASHPHHELEIVPQERSFHRRKGISHCDSDNEPGLCPSDELGGKNLQYTHAGKDWRSRKWMGSNDPTVLNDRRYEPRNRHHRRRHQQNSASMEESISRLRQDAIRLDKESRLLLRRNSPLPGGWFSELEGISERRRRGSYAGHRSLTQSKKDKVGSRSRRRATQHVLDMHSKKKLTRKEFHQRSKGGAEFVSALQLLGESIHSSKAFSLQTLEEYLREKAAAKRLQNDENARATEANSSPPKPSLNIGVSKAERTHSLARKRGPMKPIRTPVECEAASICESEEGTNEEVYAIEPASGKSWRWMDTQHANREDGAASCFPTMPRARIGRRVLIKHQMKGRDKYNSDASFTTLDSDSETAPLMTEPEPFHDYTTDDVCGSSVDLNRSLRRETKPKMPSRFKESAKYSIEYNSRRSDYDSECKEGSSISMQRSTHARHRSLSQKHQPKTFKDLVGQPMVAQSLSNAILRGKIAPVYLFQGPRGTGKSSTARIFTAALNCSSADNLRPCGTCKECVSLYAGKNFDVREVNAAGNASVESMKLLLKHISLPALSSYKVFIIDECHLLGPESWNALLKSLEEPPSYVVFILITTDAETLPRTALSRCQKFLFSKIRDADIVSRLQMIASLENIDVEFAALQLIASRSDGSLWDAEMTLDRISLLGKTATLSVVQELVGIIPEKKLIEFLEVALSSDTSSTVKAIRDFMESGVDALSLISQLATLITDVIAGNNRSAAYRLKEIRKVDSDRFRQALKVLSDAERQLRTCSDRTTWLTAAFLQFSQPNTLNNANMTLISHDVSQSQGPINLSDTSEKETMVGNEKLESETSSQQHERAMSRGNSKKGHSQSILPSGHLIGSKVHPCSISPKSKINDDLRTMVSSDNRSALPGRVFSGSNNSEQMQVVKNPRAYSMESIWKKVLANSRSSVVKQLLQGGTKLISISVTEALAVAHLEFVYLDHKNVAEKAKSTILRAFEDALCCPVDLKFTLSSACVDDNTIEGAHTPSLSIKPEQSRRRSGSFRRSSSSKFGVPVAASPRIRIPEPRRPQSSVHEEERSNNLELLEREQNEAQKRNMESQEAQQNGVNVMYDQASNTFPSHCTTNLVLDEDFKANSRGSFHEDSNAERAFSRPAMEDEEHSFDTDKDALDSESQYGTGILCWNGGKIKDGKGRHQRLRRKRRGRLLLRLVPCAKGAGRA
ncbi:hypothetical protein KP509_09G075500 [Ceratopteris richardii]|uniref:DNA-directed DNA polymerase n=1 Tax=Ceratopteris richardii TaxID=49495 RepID=A0A8T2U884_CERRI|nr:hypothetical protein KP509_09G075500 [Ceratopteris richardii]